MNARIGMVVAVGLSAAACVAAGPARPEPGAPLASWSERASAPGVVFAIGLRTRREVYDHVLPDARRWSNAADNVRFTPEGMRMDVLKTDFAQHGNWRHCILPECQDVPVGTTFYIAHSQYFDAGLITQRFIGKSPGSDASGFKQTIISRYRNSAATGEIVLTNIGQRGYPQAYRKHRGRTAHQFEGKIHQPAISGGPHYDDRIRFGKLPKHFGGIAYPQDGWMHFKQKVTVRDGVALYSLFAARDGEGWVRIIDEGVVDLRPGFAYNGFWLLPYTSRGGPDPGRRDTYTIYKDVIVSLGDIAAPDGR